MKTTRSLMALLVVLGALAAVAGPVQAGCGCNKPPPDLAAIRPNATYAGTEVTFFAPELVVGAPYVVRFSSGTTSASVTLSATAVSRRDLADAVVKPQLVVLLPDLPLGPTSVQVRDSANNVILDIDDAALTVVPQPIAVPEDLGNSTYGDYRAAVGRDGTFYMSLDMSAVQLPRIFRAQAKGYPLIFTSDQVTFYNIQGFLMQLLTAGMPGLYSVESPNRAVDSDILGYSRHEFSTFYLQHEERMVHEVVDGNWHVDGTRHVDHNHLIIAIAGVLHPNNTSPAPGATPPFNLELKRFSLFRFGLVALDYGDGAVNFSDGGNTDSYNSKTGVAGGAHGNVFTNGTVHLVEQARIKGDATAADFDVRSDSQITGQQIPLTTPQTFMTVRIPDFLTDLGSIDLSSSASRTIVAGSYLVSHIKMQNTSSLYINNCDFPVTIYVSGADAMADAMRLADDASISTCDKNPDKFSIYVAGDKPVSIGGKGEIDGVVYAPQSAIEINRQGDLFGSVIGNTLQLQNKAQMHYDINLKGGR